MIEELDIEKDVYLWLAQKTNLMNHIYIHIPKDFVIPKVKVKLKQGEGIEYRCLYAYSVLNKLDKNQTIEDLNNIINKRNYTENIRKETKIRLSKIWDKHIKQCEGI